MGVEIPTGGIGGDDPDAIHDNIPSEISAITEKVAPIAADLLIIEDSAAGNAKKRVQIGNLGGADGNTLAYTTIVGNALHGDTAADVDFLDPGDGTGIQAAISALPAQGGVILIRKGIYSLSAILTVGISKVRLMGEGMGSTHLRNTVGGANTHFSITGDVDDVEFCNMTIENRGAGSGNQPKGILAANRVMNRIRIHDIHFTYSGSVINQSISLTGSGGEWKVYNCIFDGVGDSIGVVRFDDFGGTPENVSVHDNTFLDQNRAAVSIENCNGVMFVNNTISTPQENGAYDIVRVLNGNQCRISDNVFEGTRRENRGIVMGGCANWSVAGNVFGAGLDTFLSVGIRATGGSDGRIANNVVNGGVGAAIDFISTVSTRVDISGNNLQGVNGILIGNVSSEITISNNMIENCTTGVSITAAATGVRITNNHYTTVTTPINDSGVRTVIRSNSFQESYLQTLNATPVTLFSFPLNDNTVYVFKALIAARDTAGTERAAYERNVRAHRQGGGATIGAASQDLFTDESNASLDCAWTVSGNNLILQVTGLAGTTIDWTSFVDLRST